MDVGQEPTDPGAALVIDLEYFTEQRQSAEEILAVTSAHVARQCRVPAAIRLVPTLDAPVRERVLALGDEVFGPGGEVFDRRALDEVADDPDALFLVLELDGRIEGTCFGYYEQPGNEVVDGTEFFIDSALVAPRWQRHRVGWLAAAAILLLVAELGDVRRVGIAVWSGGDVEGLLSLYRRFGFADATSRRVPYPCLAVTLLPERVDGWRALLGLPPADAGATAAAADRPSRPGP